ncbi:MAG TPA: BadF/BadG/BcrA/BcrD ATPase family protein [Longimicrobiales bacterium]
MDPRPGPGPGPIYLGLDGGGTHTTVLATDAAGAELARVEGDAGIVDARDPAARAGVLGALVRRALERAGAAPPAAALCCALAGAGRETERRALLAALEPLGLACAIQIVGDGEAAFHDAFGTGPGILLIAGTGSIAWGRAADGRTARAGGWGQVLGDEGSGYALGLAGLRAVARARDGRGPDTALTEMLLAATGVGAPEELIGWVARADKAAIAALAPRVAAAAGAGDGVAAGIVDQAARELAAHVAALHQRLGPWREPPAVALSGGLIARAAAPLRDPVVAAIAALTPPLRILDRPVDAARGAAALARALGPAA